MRHEVVLTGSIEQEDEFSHNQEFRFYLIDEDLRIVIPADDDVLIELDLDEVIQAIAMLKGMGPEMSDLVQDAVRKHMEYLAETESNRDKPTFEELLGEREE